MLANSSSFILIIICSIILGIFTKGTIPVIQTMVSESVEDHGNFEKAFSINPFASSFALAIAPIFLGFVSDKAGIISSFNVMAIAAILATIPAFGFQIVKRK